ncbi:MAG: agmatine deiminase family protein [Cytophagaceae bacterium]
MKFRYFPDYLQASKNKKYITDNEKVCKAINLKHTDSDLILDGGNLVKGKDWVIMTSKIFKENPKYSEKHLLQELENLLQVSKLIIIPQEPDDKIGHSDGIVRYYDEDTELINDYFHEKGDFPVAFRMALHNAGLNYLEVPYNPYKNRKYDEAHGLYINFLEMANYILLPVFDLPSDDLTVKQFQELYKDITVRTIHAREISKDGGVLNCCTWNVRR